MRFYTKGAFHQRPRFFYGWLVVFACLTVGIADSSVANPLLSLFMKPMGDELGWSRTSFSAVIFIAAIPGSLLAMVVGPLIDRHGPRLILALGSAIIGACLAALSSISAIWHFYTVFGIARAVMGGANSLAIPVVVANWFVRQRGRAMGIATAGTMLGSTALPLLAQWLIDRGGWQFAWIGLGLLIAVIAIIPSALFVRRRPEDIGLLPDGEVPSERKQVTPLSPGHSLAAKVPTAESAWSRKAALVTPAFWLLTLAEAQAALATGAVNMHQFPHLTDVGISQAVAVGTVSVSSLLAVAGSFFWGLVAEKIPARYCLTIVFGMMAASIVVLMSARTIAMAYVFAMLWGLSRGGIIPLLAIIWAGYFGRISLASVRGISLPVHLIANAFGPIIAGGVYDTTGSYQKAFIVFIVFSLASALCILLSRPPKMVTS